MDCDYIKQVSSMCCSFSILLSAGQKLTEDEAMYYFVSLAYLKNVNRMLEICARCSALEEEKRFDDEQDNGAGSTAPNPPPAT